MQKHCFLHMDEAMLFLFSVYTKDGRGDYRPGLILFRFNSL